jgi:hypothetical protein
MGDLIEEKQRRVRSNLKLSLHSFCREKHGYVGRCVDYDSSECLGTCHYAQARKRGEKPDRGFIL